MHTCTYIYVCYYVTLDIAIYDRDFNIFLHTYTCIYANVIRMVGRIFVIVIVIRSATVLTKEILLYV